MENLTQKINRLYELLTIPVTLDYNGLNEFRNEIKEISKVRGISVEEGICMAFMKGFHAGIQEALDVLQKVEVVEDGKNYIRCKIK